MFNMTIKFRLIATMAFMGVMLVIGGLMGGLGVRNNNAVIKSLYSDHLPSLDALGSSRVLFLRGRTAIDRAIAHPEEANFAETVKRAEDFVIKSNENWTKYLSFPMSAEEKGAAEKVAVIREKYLKDGFNPMVNALKAGNRDEADRLNMTVVPTLFAEYSDHVGTLTNYQFKAAETLLNNSQAEYKIFIWVDVIGVVLGLSAVFASAYFLLAAISNPLKFVLEQFDAIGNGDLSTQIRAKSRDEMGLLLTGLENMRQNLAQTVTIVRQGSSSIAVSSEEIANGNMDLSARTENQAASLEETASSMEELTSTVQQMQITQDKQMSWQLQHRKLLFAEARLLVMLLIP